MEKIFPRDFLNDKRNIVCKLGTGSKKIDRIFLTSEISLIKI